MSAAAAMRLDLRDRAPGDDEGASNAFARGHELRRERSGSGGEGDPAGPATCFSTVPLLENGNVAIFHDSVLGASTALPEAMGYSSRMASHSATASNAPYTWDDFLTLEEDDLRELIDGELVEVEVPTLNHEEVVMELGTDLCLWARAHGGHALASGYKVRVSARSGVMPDLQLYRKGNEVSPDQNHGLERGRADLVVEVVSPSSRRYDRVTKLRWYAQLGVPEYWIVDPEGRTFERLVLREGSFVIAASLEGEETFRPESFEGLEIPLARLWG
jgi:Uma2 family endonuclease